MAELDVPTRDGPPKALSVKRQYISFADWSMTEYLSATLSVLSAQVRYGSQGSRLRARLGDLYAPSSVYTLNYAHTGLALALVAFQQRRHGKTEVLIPAYICPSVVKTVIACGLDPVPVDIGDDLNLTPATLAAALSERTLAVVAPHMFGCPLPIQEIETLCRDAGVFLIDDAAQVVGIQAQGRPLGSFGDVGLISFAQSKTIVTGMHGSGGVLLVNEASFDAELQKVCRELPAPYGRISALSDFLWNHLWSAYTGSSGDRFERFAKWLGWRPFNHAQQYAQISNLEAGVAIEQLVRLEQIIATRLRVAHNYHLALQGQTEIDFPQYESGRYLTRVMLLLPEYTDVAACRAYLQKHGVETRLGYQMSFPAQAATHKADALSKRLLGVPCGPAIGAADAEQICQILRQAIHTSKQKS